LMQATGMFDHHLAWCHVPPPPTVSRPATGVVMG
jgi:hypothetical protein